MKPVQIVLIIIFCALVATRASLSHGLKRYLKQSVAKQGILSSQQFEQFYGMDTFTFNKEAYVVLINQKTTALYKLNNAKLGLYPANLFGSNQKLIQYKIDSSGRLALVLQEGRELIAELLDSSSRVIIKLGTLDHEQGGHDLCCADILSEGDELYVWHESELIKFDLKKKPFKKIFDQKLSFSSSDKGSLLASNGKVYLEMHDNQKHFFESGGSIFHSQPSESFPMPSEKCDGSAGMEWNPKWPRPYANVEKVLSLGCPVMLTAREGILYLDEFNHWNKITPSVPIFEHATSYALAKGKILFVGQREDGKGNINYRRIIVFDTINNSYDILTLELGKAFDSTPQDSLR